MKNYYSQIEARKKTDNMKFNYVRKITITSAQQFCMKFLLRIKKLCGEIIVNRMHILLRKVFNNELQLDVSSTY